MQESRERAPVQDLHFQNHGELRQKQNYFEEFESEGPGHECGLRGEFGSGGDLVYVDAAESTKPIQGRGHHAFGGDVINVATETVAGYKDTGLIEEVLAKIPDSKRERLANFTGEITINQVRWGTVYGLTKEEEWRAAQPYRREEQHVDDGINDYAYKSKYSSIAHNGNVDNAFEVAMEYDVPLVNCTTDSLALASTIDKVADERGGVVPAIDELRSKLKGSYCLIIGRDSKLYGARDPHGLLPLSIGRKPNGNIILASESVVFDNDEAEFIRDVDPGEVVEIRDIGDGPEIVSHSYEGNEDETFCSLGLAYQMDPESLYKGEKVKSWRYKLGEQLADEAHIQNPDDYIVVGIPASGTYAAKGFADKAGIKNVPAIKKIKKVRAFMKPGRTDQKRTAREKYAIDFEMLNEARWKDRTHTPRKVIRVDDTIVRGDATESLSDMLEEGGIPPEENEVMTPFPEIINSCHLGTTIQQKDLHSYKKNYEEKCKKLRVSAMRFLSRAGFRKVAPETCGGCVGDGYPIDPPTSWEDEEFSLLDRLPLTVA
jgi:amidophosphoribosyltransferase